MGSTLESRNVLVVEDEALLQASISRTLRLAGFATTCVGLGREAIKSLEGEGDVDAMLVDLNLPDMNGIEIVRSVHASRPAIPIVVMTGDPSMASAVEAMRSGAYDYLTKPLSADGLVIALQQAIEAGQILKRRPKAARSTIGDSMVGGSPRFVKVLSILDAAAATNSSVLILGESGTGKELAARALHDRGPRAAKPFIAINCGAFTESLLESELFGHVKGAFTGAVTAHRGLFEAATGGTIFLDEVGELRPTVQVRLLRVLQERKVRAVGSSEERPTDVRVIAATNRDLAAMVQSGDFRRDLFYRLNVLTVMLPALRERREDILPLMEHFAEKHARLSQRVPPIFDDELRRRFVEYEWPGNIRELENLVERCIALSVDGHVPTDVLFEHPRSVDDSPTRIPFLDQALPDALREFQEHYLRELLKSAEGNLSEASRRAGVDRTNLKRLLRRYGLLKATKDDIDT